METDRAVKRRKLNVSQDELSPTRSLRNTVKPAFDETRAYDANDMADGIAKRNISSGKLSSQRSQTKPTGNASRAAQTTAETCTMMNGLKKLDPPRSATTDPSQDGSSRPRSTIGFFKQFLPQNSTISSASKQEMGRVHSHDSNSHNEKLSWKNGEKFEEGEHQEKSQEPLVRSSGRERRRSTRYEGEDMTPRSMDRSSARRSAARIKQTKGNLNSRIVDEVEVVSPTGNIHSRGKVEEKALETDSLRGEAKRLEKQSKARQPRVQKPLNTEDAPPSEVANGEGKFHVVSTDNKSPQTPRTSMARPANQPPSKSASLSMKSKETAALDIDIVKFGRDQMEAIKEILLLRLTGRSPIQFTNLDAEYVKVSQLVTQTVVAGESNSMLLIGAHGSGKTTVTNQILRELAATHPNEFHVVRLNGLIHTDDKIALKEIWRQIGREMDLSEEASASKNYADTLTKLLALLSLPTEQGRNEAPGRITKSVVFIIDEFDLFAAHPRQTLLYNLFDIAQSRKAPIAVLGLTTRIDITEALEKRVKSRFSHRYVHLGLQKSLSAFRGVCKAILRLDDTHASTTEQERQIYKPLETTGVMNNTIEGWNAVVNHLFADDAFSQCLSRVYYTTKSVPEFLHSLMPVVSTMPTASNTDGTTLSRHFATRFHVLNSLDSGISILSSLSSLSLALLICAARLSDIHYMETVSFAQTHEEYTILGSKAKIQASASGALAQGAGSRVWSKNVAKGAWEELQRSGLLLPDASSGGGKVRVDIALDEIGASGVDLGSWARWCKEV